MANLDTSPVQTEALCTVATPGAPSTPSTREVYDVADRQFSDGSSTRLRFSEQLCVAPIEAKPAFRRGHTRLGILHEFFDGCLSIFREGLRGAQPRLVHKWLMNDTPASLGRRWHLRLPDVAYTRPAFFRTDECPNGRILEIQCPGSGWGDLQFMRDTYLRVGGLPEEQHLRCSQYDPAGAFCREVTHLCGRDAPSVLHLLDNASAPGPMRYFMAATSPPLAYWGLDSGVVNRECHFVRSHSFYGLVAENLFQIRLQQAVDGELKFDLPPIILFDQKTTMVLPFWEHTRDRFSDRVREAFAYTYPFTLDGFRDEHGAWVTLEDFKKRPWSGRQYFVKYAGADVAYNWGSRAVYCLSENGFKKALALVEADLARGRPWIIQPDLSGRETVSFHDRKLGTVVTEPHYAKYSRFYGPRTQIGARVMYRQTAKVHGQKDTAIGLVL